MKLMKLSAALLLSMYILVSCSSSNHEHAGSSAEEEHVGEDAEHAGKAAAEK